MMATTDSRHHRMRSTSASKTNVPSPPMHEAIMNGDLKKLQQLLKSGDLQLHPVTKETPLHMAARSGSIECLRWLLDNGINSPMDKDRDGSTPGHYCAVYGQLEALKELLVRGSKKKQELVRAIDENGLTILSLATLQDNLSMVTWIVDNFPETGKIKDTNGDLPIHFASAGGSLEMVKLFVRKFGRQYAEEMDLKHIKPVYYAAQNGKLDILKYLLTEVKVDSKAREKGGMTIMHAATTGHKLVIVKWLIEHLGPKTILSRSYDGATPLHIAAAQGYTDLLEYFIDSLDDLSDMNVRDDILATPAHDAAEFGEINSLLVLLKHGADITIKDKESKTPYDLAVEKNHTEMIAMMKDYREKGPKSLIKYDKTPPASNLTGVDTTSSQDLLHRTSQISNVKQEASSLIERRKDETMTRKTSLLQLHDEDNSSADELEQQLMNPARSDRPSRTSDGSSSTHRRAVPHVMGPQDELYAVVDKHLKKKSRDKMSDVESESMHRGKMSNGFSDAGSLYRSHQHNVETASNFSRPSRVKYYDNESSASSIGSSVSQKIDSGRNHVPGFYPASPGPGMFPQGMPPRPPMGPGGYPYPPNYQYPYFSAMVAQHYGYPHPHQQHMPGKPKTTGERMHMEALQKSGHPLYGPPMYPPVYPGYSNPYQNRQRGRGRGKGGRPSSSHSSARSMPVKRNNGYQKNGGGREIGFGPSSVSDDHLKSKAGQNGYVAELEEFHPPPPPITSKGSVNDPRELQSVDENFIMVQASVEGQVPTQASEGTQLQRAKIPSVYDGRYDQYIETDSEEERVLDEHIGASALAECALILAMGPMCGLLGLTKRRKEEPVSPVSPAIFAEMEAKETSKQWSSRDDVRKNEIELREDVPKTNATLEDWADVLGMSASVQNTPVTGGYLGGSIRARQDGMSQLKSSSLHQSLASLANDDDEDDVLSVVVGGKKASKSKQRSKDSRKSRKKSKESSKDETKRKKKLIVKPSKKKDKEKEMDVTLKVSESGPIEVKNTAFDSDSDKDKKKRKKGKKKDNKQPVQTSEEEIDELLTKTQRQFQEIQEMYPTAEESTDTPTENELKELEKMFPQNSETNDSLAKLQKMNSQSLTPQQEIRMQVIRSIIAGNDPELKKQVLALISDGWNPVDENLSTSSSANLTSELEAKIMDAQEKQREETVKQLRSQAEMSESMQQRMQGEMKSYMETIQAEFERQRTMWKQQLDDQKKMMQMETKSRKKKTKHYPRSTSNSDTDSVELVSPKIVEPALRRTFKADIVAQNPLNWDGFNARSADKIIMPPEPPSVKILLSNVNDPELKNKLFRKRRPARRTTSTDLLQTEEALKLYSKELQSEDSDDEFATSIAKPATRKRADVRSSKRI